MNLRQSFIKRGVLNFFNVTFLLYLLNILKLSPILDNGNVNHSAVFVFLVSITIIFELIIFSTVQVIKNFSKYKFIEVNTIITSLVLLLLLSLHVYHIFSLGWGLTAILLVIFIYKFLK